MKKLSSFGAVAFAALVAALAFLGFTAPAQAYPENQIYVTLSAQTVYSGRSFTATASSSSTACSWSIDWNGSVRTGHSQGDQAFNATFRAPRVSKVTKIPLHATCAYASPNGRGSANWSETLAITVLPRRVAVSAPGGSHGSGTGGSDLPNTGGPNLLFLVGGLVLLVSGATAVTVARRRAEEAETQASGA